jgi:hypothetical protein
VTAWNGIAAVVLVTALVGAAPLPRRESVSGTYRLQGTARVVATPVFDGDLEVHADAVLEPGARPREIRARLASEGYRCDLVASLAEGSALSFASGQRCVLDVRSEDARGRVEARLASGSGRVHEGRLALELAWEISGALSVRTASKVQLLGRDVELPSAWTPEAPLKGDARVTADGWRDESRAPTR